MLLHTEWIKNQLIILFLFNCWTFFFEKDEKKCYIIIRPCGPAEIKLKIVTRVKIDVDWSPLANNFQLVPQAHTVRHQPRLSVVVRLIGAQPQYVFSSHFLFLCLHGRRSLDESVCVSSVLGFSFPSIFSENVDRPNRFREAFGIEVYNYMCAIANIWLVCRILTASF